MPGSTDVEEAALLDYWVNTRTPTTKFLGASSTVSAEAGTSFTEPSGGGYARVAVPPASWNAAVAGAPSLKTNSATITFPVATTAWFTGGAPLVEVGLFAASSGGPPLRRGLVVPTRTVAIGQQLQFAPGDLQLIHGEWNGSS